MAGRPSTELQFASVLAAPASVVWERAVSVSGANDELWPPAKMTLPFVLDSHTPPEQIVGQEFRSWMLALGFVPIYRRTIRIEAFEPGTFCECSTNVLMGQQCHERTVTEVDSESALVTDRLVLKSRGRLVDAAMRAGVSLTFRRRHRRLARYFDRKSAA